MSDGGKPRQPSAKHTLDEVLKGLQDLVRNELAEERASAPAVPAARKTLTARAPSPTPLVDAAEPADAIPVLTDPIGHAVPGVKNATRQAARMPAAASVAKPNPAGGLQAELPFANSEDIPVLQHVVVPPPAGARENGRASVARRIAHEVASRLAAEAARAGTSRLEPAMIRRLEDLLREALEKQAAASPRS